MTASTSDPSGIVIERLTKIHRGKRGRPARVIFDGFSLTVAPDEIVTVLGRNGCGKSTLLRVLAGLDTDVSIERLEPKPQSRNGFHGGWPWPWRRQQRTRGSEEQGNGHQRTQFALVPAARRDFDGTASRRAKNWVSVASQDYKSVLLPWYTVRENLEVAARLSHPGMLQREAAALAETAIDRFIIAPVWVDALPKTLSGGQAQRAVLAGAFVVNPTCVLLDEPFAALDFDVHIRIRATVRREIKRLKAPALAIVHSIEDAVFLGDRVIVLSPDQPTRVLREFPVRLPADRTPEHLDTQEFIDLEREVRTYVLDAFPPE